MEKRKGKKRVWTAVAGASVFTALAVAVFVIASFADQDIARDPSFTYFKENIAPILATTCSGKNAAGKYVCHGRPAGEFIDYVNTKGYGPRIPHIAPTMMASSCIAKCHKKTGEMRFSFPLGPAGKLESEKQMVIAFQKARSLAQVGGKAKFAKILRMPLGAQSGGFGLYHGGGEVFESSADPRFRKLTQWVRIENSANHAKKTKPSKAERFFGEKVLPVFARNGCMASSCHIFNHSSFLIDPGMPAESLSQAIKDRFTPEQISFNRMTSKGLIQRLVFLDGDIEQSRILKKLIPLEKGGVLHRGGNNQFFTGPEDPDYRIVREWLRLERKEAVAKLRIGGQPAGEDRVGKVRGIVFVRTRTDNHRRYLDVGKYLPGGDLYLLKLREGETLETAAEKPVNLTKRFHPGTDADVREPDVRYDGRAILFAMRAGEDENLNIYELSLDENLDYVNGSFRRLTYGPKRVNGNRVHYTDPTYVPDPLDEGAAGGGYNLEKADVVCASNLAGEVARSVERGIVGEADGGDRNTIIDFDRPEADGAFVGRRVSFVSGTNKGEWRTIAAFKNMLYIDEEKRSVITLDRSLPKPVDSSCVYVIERDPAGQPGFLPSYSVYGMKYAPPGKERLIYKQTFTRITWTPGQDLDISVRSTGEVFYTSQRSAVDKYGKPIFNMASCRRHLDTRFSFPTHQGNRSQVLVYADNHELPTGLDIHVGLDPDNLWEGGNLSVSDHQFGPGIEARNPNDYATGMFDENGVVKATGADITNTRFNFSGKSPAHPRFVFKKIGLFPQRGSKAVSRTGFSPGGIFRDAIPLPDGGILVSYSPKPINHFDPDANPDFDLYVLRGAPGFQPVGGKGLPKVRLTKIAAASDAGMSDIQAYPISVRLKPKINAGKRPKKEHLIRYPGMKPDKRPATYLERNYLLIDSILRDPSPVGKHVAYDRDPLTGQETREMDKVKFVRFVEAIPMTPDLAQPVDREEVRNGDPESTLVSNGIHDMKRMVVEAPLEDDGSIYITLPSNVPMVIQSLNGDRMALRQEARYYFFVPNEPFTISPAPSETFQTCGSCMGTPTGKPKDLFGPRKPFLGQGKVKAIEKARGKPPGSGLTIKDRLSIDFVRDIQPILDVACVACHRGDGAAAGLSLTGEPTRYYTNAYESLMQLEDPSSGWYGRKKYVSERDGLAVESFLIEKLFGKELKAPRKLSGDAPHPSERLFLERGMPPAPLTDKQRMFFVRWIDFGATFRGPGPN